jgi:hypothetical protein
VRRIDLNSYPRYAARWAPTSPREFLDPPHPPPVFTRPSLTRPLLRARGQRVPFGEVLIDSRRFDCSLMNSGSYQQLILR